MMSARYFIMLGPQGSGKGTQAEKLADYFNVHHVSTGVVFRRHLSEKTKLGREAKVFLDKGKLVSDKITNDMVSDIIETPLYENGIIFDGYPRTISQAKYLDELLSEYDVIHLELSTEVIMERLSGRRICPDEHIYHIEFNPPKHTNVCDIDALPLTQREDDTPDFIEKRLNAYHKQTEPLLKHYEKKRTLHSVNGNQSIEKVFKDIIKSL